MRLLLSPRRFENKITDLVARDIGDTVKYTWALQNDRFIAHTLNAHKCDVMIGVSHGMVDVDTMRPYYESTYVFVSRTRDNLAVTSPTDPRPRKLKIGFHLVMGPAWTYPHHWELLQ